MAGTESRLEPCLALQSISKHYSGIRALNDVDFSTCRGTIHAILGENGAGKSTLIKIISGVVQPSAGRILLNGRARVFSSPDEANAAGIACVFQELSLVPELSVADNISIANPPRRLGFINRRAQHRRALELLARVGCDDIDPRALVRDMPLARRQMVEIAKALGKNPGILILDEATSALTHKDVDTLFRVLDELRREGLAILYISHRMHEIDILANVLSVFRNGQHVETFAKGERTASEIVQMMIGREITAQYPEKPTHTPSEVMLDVDDLRWEERLRGVSLRVERGEIVGLGGLDGQGQTELLLALFGVLKDVQGSVLVNGVPVAPRSPHQAKNRPYRTALIPEDRKTEGLMLSMSIADNLVAASYDRIGSTLFIDGAKEKTLIDDAIKRLSIKIGSPNNAVSTLSGGNQQKVVIGKWLATEPLIILLNDPTRGIDVGTKQEIYLLLRQLADAGSAILLYSSDYDELIGCCDRVAVMYGGRVRCELSGPSLTERALVANALNIDDAEVSSKPVEGAA